MNTLTIDSAGLLTLERSDRCFILPSPVGTLISGGTAYYPESAQQQGNIITLHFPQGDCTLAAQKNTGYFRLTLLSAPENTEGFVFGPYQTEASSYGEILGAGWYDDGAVSCIQSLMPKVVGGCKIDALKNPGTFPLHSDPAAEINQKIYLQCSVTNRTKPSVTDYLDMKNVLVEPVPGPDGAVEGAAVALIAAESAEELLSVISDMEIQEGLPHPTFHGNYIKTCKDASSFYMIFGGSRLSNEERIRYAGRAGVSGIYFSDLLDRWGHFRVDRNNFPGGLEEVAALSEKAEALGTNVGTHTLSNFIHTFDPYVTPVPHDHLLVMDKTVLTASISAEDTCLFVRDANNFATGSTLNVLRIGNELITFESFDTEKLCLTGCVRGAFDTAAEAHPEGSAVARLWDHGYRTLFPDIHLQKEMADALGRLIRDGKLRRMSFDGLEGCAYTGAGEYAMADYVQRVLNITGNNILCEGSRITHYLWHAFAYCNWGEPWYDDVRRGGMHVCRAGHIPFFRRNLLPNMLGWYALWTNRGRYEASTPENVEFILSRSAAYDAGMALFTEAEVVKNHGKFQEYLDLVRLWGDFRLHADIPQELRTRMQDETSNWHLEKTVDGWNLSELVIRKRDLDYTDCVVKAEAGYVDNNVKESTVSGRRNHASHMVCDLPYDGISEPPRFRIRIGEPGHGYIENLRFHSLYFPVTARGGDYLVYEGGTELLHYDANFNLLERVVGEGKPLTQDDFWFKTLEYTTDEDDCARYIFTEFCTRKIYSIPRISD